MSFDFGVFCANSWSRHFWIIECKDSGSPEQAVTGSTWKRLVGSVYLEQDRIKIVRTLQILTIA